MKIHSSISALLILSIGATAQTVEGERPGATAVAPEIKISIASVSVGTRLPSDGRGMMVNDEPFVPTGARLCLLLTPSEGLLLPTGRAVLKIDRLVDDTGIDLTIGMSTQARPSTDLIQRVDDGTSLLVALTTPRPLSRKATRLFVQGSVVALFSREAPARHAQKLGPPAEAFSAGPYRFTNRNVSTSSRPRGNRWECLFDLLEGEPALLGQVRLLDTNGVNVVTDDGWPEVRQDFLKHQRLVFPVNKTVTDDMTLEILHHRTASEVLIPFEAQVDLGYTKAGPVQPVVAAASSQSTKRVWAQKMVSQEIALPPRRPPMEGVAPDEAGGPTAPRVDLFSLTLGKPPPAEKPGTPWNADPAPQLLAAGFTQARLLITTPGMCIVGPATDEPIEIHRFEDDVTGPLGTSYYVPEHSYGFHMMPFHMPYSPSGDQMLAAVSMVSTPGKGAARCRLAGRGSMRIAKDVEFLPSGPIEPLAGEVVTLGPYQCTVIAVRMQEPTTPLPQQGGEAQLHLSIKGPLNRLLTIEALGAQQQSLFRTSHGLPNMSSPPETEQRISLPIRQQAQGVMLLRLRTCGSVEILKVPFDLNFGLNF